MFIKWIPAFETGLQDIDRQHQKIIDMINELHESQIRKDPGPICRKIIVEMVEYTQEHFTYEETMMRVLVYPGLDVQRRSHRAMVNNIREVLTKLKAGRTVSVRELLAFLQRWWSHHIQQEDMKLGQWVRQQATSKTAKPETA